MGEDEGAPITKSGSNPDRLRSVAVSCIPLSVQALQPLHRLSTWNSTYVPCRRSTLILHSSSRRRICKSGHCETTILGSVHLYTTQRLACHGCGLPFAWVTSFASVRRQAFSCLFRSRLLMCRRVHRTCADDHSARGESGSTEPRASKRRRLFRAEQREGGQAGGH